MSWILDLDTTLFRFINLKLSNPLFDAIMPSLAGPRWFIPVVILLVIGFLWKGGSRGRLFVVVLLLVLALGDGLVINPIKHAASRPRPSRDIADANLLVGQGGNNSMPSSHTSTWWAIAVVASFYYPRSRYFLFPFAAVMGFSRVYLGAHYPSDVLVGAILGTGYAVAGAAGLQMSWRIVGRRFFPLWWERLPRLLPDAGQKTPAPASVPHRTLSDRNFLADQQWSRVAALLILATLAARLIFLATGRMDLSEDEAYQWVWSKHLALSYYSKPLLIAVAHFVDTYVWGDTEFGVRFLPPVLATILAFVVFRFMRAIVGARTALITILIFLATPMLAAGATLMTIDPLLVTFWTLAMVVGWRAVQPTGTTAQWMMVGLWTGLGFLSKYTAALIVPCFAIYFVLWKPARRHLRTPGPWLALLVLLVCTAPVIIWNSQHGWVTIQHVSENAKLDKPWRPTYRFFLEFLASEAGLLNPIFFIGISAAMLGLWSSANSNSRAIQRYLFCAGAPLFLGYLLYTVHSRVQANWIAASVIPLLCLMVVYWRDRWADWRGSARPALIAAIAFGAVANVLLYDTSLIGRVAGKKLSVDYDPTRRVRGIEKIASAVDAERKRLAEAGTNVFIVTSHYGLAGQLSFYIPDARAGLPDRPIVYPRYSSVARNQFYFWPEYNYWTTRRGQSALYLTYKESEHEHEHPLPTEVTDQFESVQELTPLEIKDRGQVLHTLRLYLLNHVR